MAGITLITGGCRSGKSRHAQELAEQAGQRRLFIATAPVLDAEMRKRVEKHRQMRQGRGWETVEEQIDLSGCLHRADTVDVILCDCLTLWINNLLFDADKSGGLIDEDHMTQLTRRVCDAGRSIPARVFFVTNEVGMGIVPENNLSRLYRDLVGRCNQEIAAVADSVVLMVSGIPINVKG
jgi:adenosylcobinamide kinase/adenosylcobinamide-phosphate guanylyltransferase